MKYLILFSLFVHQINSIYHGRSAKVNQFPYVVLIQSENSFCSGTIITDRHILTAAHCIDDTDEVIVHVGAHNYDDIEDKTDGIQYKSDEFWVHEDFEMPSANDDIGIIRLKQPLGFNNKVKSIPISAEEDVELNEKDKTVFLAGWGYSEDNDGISETLQYAQMNLLRSRTCNKNKKHYIEDFDKDDHICLKKVKGMPCSGDSGSAVISRKSKKIIGILSYVKDADGRGRKTQNDCVANVPAVALRISSYLDWISEKAGIQFEEDDDDSGSDENESDDDDESDNEVGEESDFDEQDQSDESDENESDESSHN